MATRAHFDSLQDSAVLQDSDGEGKIVYLFLPIYKACLFRTSFTSAFLTCVTARKPTRCDKHVHPTRRAIFRTTSFTPLQRYLRSRACHAHLSLRKTVFWPLFLEPNPSLWSGG